MILGKKPVMLAEVKGMVKGLEEKQELKDYLKKFTKLTKDKAGKLVEDIKALDNPKIKEVDIIKIVDFLPKEKEELGRIFTETGLSEEETNAILEVVKKY